MLSRRGEEHSCHILPFQQIMWNRYFPSEPAKHTKATPNLFQKGVEYGKYEEFTGGEFFVKNLGTRVATEVPASITGITIITSITIVNCTAMITIIITSSSSSSSIIDNNTHNSDNSDITIDIYIYI